jgi:putative membrane protein insertion efficiency factor
MLSDLPRQLLLGLVKGYRLLLSPALGSNCRFEPSCSQYALDALQRHGALGGSYLTLRRLGRCHPWCEGGLDAVPEAPPSLFSSLLRQKTPGFDPAAPVSPSSEKKYPS